MRRGVRVLGRGFQCHSYHLLALKVLKLLFGEEVYSFTNTSSPELKSPGPDRPETAFRTLRIGVSLFAPVRVVLHGVAFALILAI